MTIVANKERPVVITPKIAQITGITVSRVTPDDTTSKEAITGQLWSALFHHFLAVSSVSEAADAETEDWLQVTSPVFT